MIVYRELSSLERDLGIPAKTLYALSSRLSAHYRKVPVSKKGGGSRILSVPDPALKAVQRRIADVLLVHMTISPFARAYRPGGSTLVNAAPHVGRPLVVKLDICHFFDSIRYSDVKDRAFPASIYAEPIRILLAMLCYYKESLPQGAPTSPAVSNIILHDFDWRVGRWCRERHIAYTRYCDDLTFSGDFSPGELIRFVRTQLRQEGFLLNEQKTKVLRPHQRQIVTGIVVNEKPAVPAEYRRKLRQELYYCRKFGIRSHLERLGLDLSEQAYVASLLGRVSYALQINPEDRDLREARAWLLSRN